MIDYSVNSLLLSVKQRAMSASNQNLLTDGDIVRIASEELQSVVLPFIESCKGEYYTTNEDQTFVQGQTAYTLPQRATGTKLRDVCLLDNQNNEVNLPYIAPEDLKFTWAYAPYQFGFYPRDNQIILVFGNLIGSGSYNFVRMIYFRRPNTLCVTAASDATTANAGQVTAINTLTNEVTLDFVPPAWTTATLFDTINNLPPFQSRADNSTVSAISGFVLTFTTLPTGIKIGDWVSEANFSPIMQIPVEAQRLLETLTAARILQYSGDPAFQVFQAQAEQNKKDLLFILSPRVDGSPQKIPQRNRLWGGW
jgi:hypothetical protein